MSGEVVLPGLPRLRVPEAEARLIAAAPGGHAFLLPDHLGQNSPTHLGSPRIAQPHDRHIPRNCLVPEDDSRMKLLHRRPSPFGPANLANLASARSACHQPEATASPPHAPCSSSQLQPEAAFIPNSTPLVLVLSAQLPPTPSISLQGATSMAGADSLTAPQPEAVGPPSPRTASPWAALPPAALAALAAQLFSLGAWQVLRGVCRAWRQGLGGLDSCRAVGSLQPRQRQLTARGAVMDPALPPLPAWARPLLQRLVLVLSQPAAGAPLERWGPADSRELAARLLRLGLGQGLGPEAGQGLGQEEDAAGVRGEGEAKPGLLQGPGQQDAGAGSPASSGPHTEVYCGVQGAGGEGSRSAHQERGTASPPSPAAALAAPTPCSTPGKGQSGQRKRRGLEGQGEGWQPDLEQAATPAAKRTSPPGPTMMRSSRLTPPPGPSSCLESQASAAGPSPLVPRPSGPLCGLNTAFTTKSHALGPAPLAGSAAPAPVCSPFTHSQLAHDVAGGQGLDGGAAGQPHTQRSLLLVAERLVVREGLLAGALAHDPALLLAWPLVNLMVQPPPPGPPADQSCQLCCSPDPDPAAPPRPPQPTDPVWSAPPPDLGYWVLEPSSVSDRLRCCQLSPGADLSLPGLRPAASLPRSYSGSTSSSRSNHSPASRQLLGSVSSLGHRALAAEGGGEASSSPTARGATPQEGHSRPPPVARQILTPASSSCPSAPSTATPLLPPLPGLRPSPPTSRLELGRHSPAALAEREQQGVAGAGVVLPSSRAWSLASMPSDVSLLIVGGQALAHNTTAPLTSRVHRAHAPLGEPAVDSATPPLHPLPAPTPSPAASGGHQVAREGHAGAGAAGAAGPDWLPGAVEDLYPRLLHLQLFHLSPELTASWGWLLTPAVTPSLSCLSLHTGAAGVTLPNGALTDLVTLTSLRVTGRGIWLQQPPTPQPTNSCSSSHKGKAGHTSGVTARKGSHSTSLSPCMPLTATHLSGLTRLTRLHYEGWVEGPGLTVSRTPTPAPDPHPSTIAPSTSPRATGAAVGEDWVGLQGLPGLRPLARCLQELVLHVAPEQQLDCLAGLSALTSLTLSAQPPPLADSTVGGKQQADGGRTAWRLGSLPRLARLSLVSRGRPWLGLPLSLGVRLGGSCAEAEAGAGINWEAVGEVEAVDTKTLPALQEVLVRGAGLVLQLPPSYQQGEGGGGQAPGPCLPPALPGAELQLGGSPGVEGAGCGGVDQVLASLQAQVLAPLLQRCPGLRRVWVSRLVLQVPGEEGEGEGEGGLRQWPDSLDPLTAGQAPGGVVEVVEEEGEGLGGGAGSSLVLLGSEAAAGAGGRQAGGVGWRLPAGGLDGEPVAEGSEWLVEVEEGGSLRCSALW